MIERAALLSDATSAKSLPVMPSRHSIVDDQEAKLGPRGGGAIEERRRPKGHVIRRVRDGTRLAKPT